MKPGNRRDHKGMHDSTATATSSKPAKRSIKRRVVMLGLNSASSAPATIQHALPGERDMRTEEDKAYMLQWVRHCRSPERNL